MTMSDVIPLPARTSPTVERVLVAVDGGSGSRAALRWVSDHLARSSGQVLVVSVAPEGDSGADADAELRAAALVLRTVLDDVEVLVQRRNGTPVDQLAIAAEEFAADLLVVGTHASDEAPRSGRITVAGRLAARAGCAVVVVPAHWTPGPGAVVVGSSIDSASDSAIDFAYRIADRSGRRLVVTHTWELPTVGEITITPGGGESIPERQRVALATVVRDIAARGAVDVQEDLRRGDAAAGLSAAAEGAAMIVVGRRARSAAAALLLGSTSRALVTAPPCPVVVVPAPRAGIRVAPETEHEEF